MSFSTLALIISLVGITLFFLRKDFGKNKDVDGSE